MLETTAKFRQRIFNSDEEAGTADLENLLKQISLGDRAAFRMLCNRVGPGFFTLLSRMVQRRDIAKDLLEDVFVRIWRNACLFDGRINDAKVWLFSITRRQAIEWMRKSSPNEGGPEAGEKFLLPDSNDENYWVLPGTSSKIRHCLEGMKLDIKKALTLCFSFGLSHDELAIELGVPLETAKSRVRNGLAEIRQLVGASQ